MLETPIAYCSEKVGRENSSLHYALLFQSQTDKAFWMGCFTLAYELRTTCMKQLEAGLTQVKLGWWRNALVESKQKVAQHPVILAIGSEHVKSVDDAQWATLIEQIASSCDVKRYNNLNDWHQTIRMELHPWKGLIESKGQFKENDNFEQFLGFWAFSTQLSQLLRVAKYLDEGFQPIPVDYLSRLNVTAEELKQRQHNEKTKALFIDIGNTLIQQANKQWKKMPADQRLFARPLRALFRMRVAEFKLHHPSSYHLLTEQKKITPLKKFTTAWTTHVLRW
jgi:phytoene/squalene synthetase